MAYCPDKEQHESDICYHCGSTEHRIKECQIPRRGGKLLTMESLKRIIIYDPFPGRLWTYATCFVCNYQGHLSGACPKNPHGLYPNGGGCRYCKSNQHLAKDCSLIQQNPMKTKLSKDTSDPGISVSAEDDDVHITLNKMHQRHDIRRSRIDRAKIVKF